MPGAGREADDVALLERFDLTGRVAVVTGGTKGLGRAAADGLAEAGAVVVVTSRHEDEAAATALELTAAWGLEATGLGADQASREDNDRVVEQVMQRHGRLDILVNNAGINIREPLVELQDEHWEQVIGVNMTGLMQLTRAAVRPMIAAGYGRIVNIGSVLSTVGGLRRNAYAASKGAVLQLTRCWDLELAEHGITCNCICPGPFQTPLNKEWMSNPETADPVRLQTAVKRFAEPIEIAGAVLLLASDAGSFMTGSAVYVDGGLTCN
jgi:NAD(P)-dependent dehydrogenase (short-subunit alcohol dehydrogenase family)